VRNRERWISLLTAAGFSREAMRRWHIQFERSASDRHREFLEFLGCSEREIHQIRSWSSVSSGEASTGAKQAGAR
jgi:hypothetical protein